MSATTRGVLSQVRRVAYAEAKPRGRVASKSLIYLFIYFLRLSLLSIITVDLPTPPGVVVGSDGPGSVDEVAEARRVVKNWSNHACVKIGTL